MLLQDTRSWVAPTCMLFHNEGCLQSPPEPLHVILSFCFWELNTRGHVLHLDEKPPKSMNNYWPQ